jgi:8-oxo-dGTP pyrophosphatase MutT (NUDIX family)
MPSYYRDPEAPRPNVPRRVGVVAVIERDGAILVQRRSDDGQWDFLGGRVDEEETLLETLHREVLEETGLHIEQATLFGVFSDPARIISYPDGNVCRLFSVVFRVTPKTAAEPIRSDESLELRFVMPDELAELDFWPVAGPVRDALLAGAPEIVVE